MTSFSLGCLLLAGTALAAPSVGFAQVAADTSQTNTPDTADTAVQDEGATIGDIVVTAQKVASTEQKTPISLRVVDGDALRTAGITDVNGLQRLAPDLGVTNDTIYTKLALRGVTAESIAEGADAALTVNIDGEYINRPFALNASFFDLDRIEVLKGPQGTLYGRNSTAGAINILTQKPTDKFEGYVTAGYGNYNAFSVQPALNIPLAHGVGVRFAGIHTQHKGYRYNFAAGRNDDANVEGARATLGWDRGILSGYLQGEYIDVDQTSTAQYGQVITTTTPGVVARPTVGADGVLGTGDDGIDYLPEQTLFKGIPRQRYPLLYSGTVRGKQYHIRGRIALALTNNFDVSYTGGYLDGKLRTFLPLSGTPDAVQFATRGPHNDVRDWSNELRLTYHDDRGTVVQGGLFYFDERQRIDTSIRILNPPFGPPGTTEVYANAFYRPNLRVQSVAAFGQADVAVTDTLKITGGVRYTRDKKTGTYINSGLGFIDPAFGLAFPSRSDIVSAVGPVGSCQGKTAGNFAVLNQCYGPRGEWSWLGGVEYTPAPNHLLYAKVSRGFRSGGFDNLTQTVINGRLVGQFDPEHITSYELGSKNRFDGGRLQFNVSAFHYDYSNLQIDNFINTTLGHATVNAGKARFNGVDTDLIVALSPNDRFTATFNYLDAKFTQYTAFATGINGGTPPLNLSGNRPPQAPKYTIAVGYDHSFDLGATGTLKAGAYSRFKSEYFLTSYNYAGDRQEGYSQTDLSLTYTTADDRFSVQAYVHNLENNIPLTFTSFTGGPPINTYNFAFGAPRTYGGTATIKF